MSFACAQGGIRCSFQLSWLNSKVSADVMQGCLQALNLPHTGSIIGGSTAQHMIRTVVLIHLGAISSVAHLLSRIPPAIRRRIRAETVVGGHDGSKRPLVAV
jgi:hypothetical protein